jgi:hypothetical protein
MLAGRAAALLIDITAVTVATGLAMRVFSLVFGMHLAVAAIASAAAVLGIFGFFAGAAALAVGAATGSTALSRGLAALMAVASYLINALAQVTNALKQRGRCHRSTCCSATSPCSTGSRQSARYPSSPSRSPWSWAAASCCAARPGLNVLWAGHRLAGAHVVLLEMCHGPD